MIQLKSKQIRIIEQYLRKKAQSISKGIRRPEFHRELQKYLIELALNFDLQGVTEYKVYFWRDDDRVGSIDVVWLDKNIPIVAFEIDSSARLKSIQKLLALNVQFRFWIYYGEKDITDLLCKFNPRRLIRILQIEGINF
jgi:hypothetical protein